MNIKDTGPYLESKESLKINESIEIIRNKKSNILLMNNNKSIKNEDNANYTLDLFCFSNFVYCEWCVYNCLNGPEEIIVSNYDLKIKISDISSTIGECKNHKSVISINPKLDKIISEFNSFKEENKQEKLRNAIFSEETGNNILNKFCYIIKNKEIKEFICNNIKADDEIYKQIFLFFNKDKNNKYKSKIMLFYFYNYMKNSFYDFETYMNVVYENWRYSKKPISFLQLINCKNQAMEPYIKVKNFLNEIGIRSFDISELIKNETQITHSEYFLLELYNDDNVELLRKKNFIFNQSHFDDLPYIFYIYD